MKQISVAIDGPAGAGKSTVARRLAAEIGAIYLDTGAMYRCVGLYMLRAGVDVHDPSAVAARASEAHVDVIYQGDAQHVLLNGEDVSAAIRQNEVSAAASAVSAVPVVREMLVARQREIAAARSVVMDGRDIGTKVLPDAPVKVFLTARAEVRAQRRYDELAAKGQPVPYEQLLQEIIERDYNDAHRAASPMTQAEDAVLIDCSDMTVDEVIAAMRALIRDREDSLQ